METLVNNIIKATGWSIFHSLWQGALLYALLVLIFLMIPRLSAQVKYSMAYGSLTLIFIGFCGTFFSFFTWPPLSAVTNTLSLSKVIPIKTDYQAEFYFPFLVGVYVTGLFIQVAILSTSYYKVLKLKQSLKAAVPPEWRHLFETMLHKLNIRKNVKFYLSNQVKVPLVIGYIKPIVLFPFAFATQLDLAHVEAILIHELAHVRRNDYLLNILKTVMETILFFNPFIWLCSNLIQREREHACDDCVVKQTNTPLTYAHALLQIELLKEKQTPVFSMAAGGNNQYLYQRIKRITDMKTTYNTTRQQLIAISITLITLCSIAWVNPLKSETPIKNKTRVTTHMTTQVNKNRHLTSTNKIHQDTLKKKKAKKVHSPHPKLPEVSTAPLPVLPKEPIATIAPPEPPAPPALADFTKYAQEMQKHFNSAEWKHYQNELKKIGLAIQKKHESPEFKQQLKDLNAQNAAIVKHFNRPDWQMQQINQEKMNAELLNQLLALEFKKETLALTEECSEVLKEEIKTKNRKELQSAREKINTEITVHKNQDW